MSTTPLYEIVAGVNSIPQHGPCRGYRPDDFVSSTRHKGSSENASFCALKDTPEKTKNSARIWLINQTILQGISVSSLIPYAAHKRMIPIRNDNLAIAGIPDQ